mmetsp:Transcript_44599/g.127247  ORF Transcript_44599/g.127247 Transcript_44599/m.127247 type:complete len:235 (+) Transcript_44599:921-1625(+)
MFIVSWFAYRRVRPVAAPERVMPTERSHGTLTWSTAKEATNAMISVPTVRSRTKIQQLAPVRQNSTRVQMPMRFQCCRVKWTCFRKARMLISPMVASSRPWMMGLLVTLRRRCSSRAVTRNLCWKRFEKKPIGSTRISSTGIVLASTPRLKSRFMTWSTKYPEMPCSSKSSFCMSVEKRFTMRPVGVVSSQAMGDRSTAHSASRWTVSETSRDVFVKRHQRKTISSTEPKQSSA